MATKGSVAPVTLVLAVRQDPRVPDLSRQRHAAAHVTISDGELGEERAPTRRFWSATRTTKVAVVAAPEQVICVALADLPTLTYAEVSELHERKAMRSPSRSLATSRACVTLSVFLLAE